MPESTPPATADGTQSRSIRSLKSLGDLRDGLLVGFAVVYVTGFLTWAFRALQLNMGYIEVFKIQYIIAGITPTACFLVILHSMLRAGESSVSRERYQGLAIVIVLLFATLLLLDLLLVVLYVYFAGTPLMSLIEFLDYPIGQIVATRVLPGLSHMGLYIFYMILALIILHRLSPHTFSKLNDQHRRNSLRMFGKGTLWLTVIILLGLAIRQYLVEVFPNTPQEIGGGQPRRAALDIQKTKISETIAKALTSNEATSRLGVIAIETSEVIHTKEVYVLYYSEKSLFFRMSPDKPIIQINREAVSAITWLPLVDAKQPVDKLLWGPRVEHTGLEAR